MERRMGESPMDFEYDNRSGMAGSSSPFPVGDPRKKIFAGKGESNSFARSSPFGSNTDPKSKADQVPHTPIKSHLTGFRETPSAFDFSSGPENASSPENADNEDTPEPPRVNDGMRNGNVTIFRGKSPVRESQTLPSKSKGVSAVANFFSSRNTSPGRGGALQRRPNKRKRREVDHDGDSQMWIPGNAAFTDSEYSDRPSSSEGPGADASNFFQSPHHQQGAFSADAVPGRSSTLASLLTFINAHPDLPHILSYYLQFLLNAALLTVFLYGAHAFWTTVRAQVLEAQIEASRGILQKIEECARNWERNECGDGRDLPWRRELCTEWRVCKERDPLIVGRASVGASTFARILNAFVEPMSWKLIAFVLACVVLAVGVPNYLLASYRANHVPHVAAPAAVPQPQTAPATPYQGGGLDGSASVRSTRSQRHPFASPPAFHSPYKHSGFDGQDAFFTPSRSRMHNAIEPRSPSPRRGAASAIEGGGSPSRRIGYR